MLMNPQNNEKYFDYRRVYDCFDDDYTFDAKGINVDYMLSLNYPKDSYNIDVKNITIDKLFDELFNEVKTYYKESKFSEDPFKVINLIADNEITAISQHLSETNRETHFNYCVKLSDRNQPEIRVSIPYVLKNARDRLERLVIDRKNNKVYEHIINRTKKPNREDFDSESAFKTALEAYDRKLLNDSSYLREEVISDLNKDLCVFIALWIHAYRFKVTISKVHSDKSNILFTHRFKGWSQPGYALTKDLKLKFTTNFGYGKSSYFRLIVVYKDVDLINFIEWIDYRVKGASVVKSYTRKYEGLIQDAGPTNKFIYNDKWLEAIEETKLICETYLKDENEFIDEFIYKSLDKMVKELAKIAEFSIVDKQLDEGHRLFNETLDSLKYKKISLDSQIVPSVVMSVKGEKITGALDFISNIMQLKKFFSVDEHIRRIKELNKKLLPMMDSELALIPESKRKLDVSLDRLYQDLNEIDDELESNLSADDYWEVFQARGSILEAILAKKNDIEVLRKCEKDIYRYKKVIKDFETRSQSY